MEVDGAIEMTWCLIFAIFIWLKWILGLWKDNNMYQYINYGEKKIKMLL